MIVVSAALGGVNFSDVARRAIDRDILQEAVSTIDEDFADVGDITPNRQRGDPGSLLRDTLQELLVAHLDTGLLQHLQKDLLGHVGVPRPRRGCDNRRRTSTSCSDRR